ncbi:ParM/StbA family protein [Noviherbaspirillum sp. CPCC 100848]|uniref:ParM/StbA family protein n=1 Tax=Noviherbaspirillum album TaxID=3080276 RepID=A0ABU6JJU8_9BURK|nr:ParM/StbA family protein [Noviherbaspirillum sp. CPCC 100848]MEC4723462.1 ParM/StbA family protein [Noviherbaspirillum sp. CPCC 100848]
MRSANGRPKSWAVVDVGHFTTDFLLMKENTYIESKVDSCEGITVAAEHLMKTLTGKGYKVTLQDCEQALRSRTIFHFGEKDIIPEVDEALVHVAARIKAKADALHGSEAASLDGILLAGGGAAMMRDRFRMEWENIKMVESPQMAVAEGYCRYGKGVMMKRAVQTPKVAAHP